MIALSLSDLQRNRVIASVGARRRPPAGHRRSCPAPAGHPEPAPQRLGRDGGVDDRPRQLLIRTEREDGDRVRVTVQRCRRGPRPQSMDKLFDAFYTTKSGGMGIGLSVSRSIIERHHGRLWAEPNDGPGATFSFSIPRDPETRRRTRHPDEDTRDAQAVHWCRSSTTTSPCASRCRTCCGSSALPPRRSHRPKRSSRRMSSSETSCLLLDIAMPGMSGPDLQQELNARRQEIPIVFITAHGDETVRPRLLAAGPSSACSSRSARRRCSTRSTPRFG